MIYTQLTKMAMQIAYQAHAGQKDKSGVPYIYHPIHLAEQMEDEDTTCVALLHDSVEDSHITIGELEQIFPRQITEAIALMTHHKSVDYLDYVRNLKDNPIARTVKLADLAHNLDESRLRGCAGIDEEAKLLRRTKYMKAVDILTARG